MTTVTFDLEAQVENLRGLKTDLDELFWAQSPTTEERVRQALGIAITQVSQRILALEDLLRRRGQHYLRVSRLGIEEAHAIERALEVLDNELVVTQPMCEAELWPKVRGVLGAADEILVATLRGASEPWQLREPPRANVVSLSR